MTQPKPRIRFTIKDYMTTPEDKRYQLLDGELILAPAPTTKHQRILGELFVILRMFVTSQINAGQMDIVDALLPPLPRAVESWGCGILRSS